MEIFWLVEKDFENGCCTSNYAFPVYHCQAPEKTSPENPREMFVLNI